MFDLSFNMKQKQSGSVHKLHAVNIVGVTVTCDIVVLRLDWKLWDGVYNCGG